MKKRPPARPPAGPPPPAAGRRWTRNRLIAAAGVLAVAVSGVLYAYSLRTGPAGPSGDLLALRPVSDSPFLNTKPDAEYIGSDACRTCHEERHVSFRHTGMGRSMAPVDLSREPADAAFDHPASKRQYQVVRRGNELWHRELLLAPGADEVLLAEYPMKYVVGSGRHSLTYLAEADGFLVESPVTWYAAKKAWGMSPGYDRPDHQGFERAVGEGCLVCHAGQARVLDRSLHRVAVGEPAIGCERCHGPGSLHAARNAGRTDVSAGPARAADHTIVNPARLPRELGEAVCQQCHLRSDATVPARGRTFADVRPGLPLQDFRADYRIEADGSPMTVVGHVEQMHLSRCYQKSATLTCLTCHSPHAEPKPADRVAHYKAACATCHAPQACKVGDDRRKRESPDNNCVQCHMPTSPTEIPHLAFTHHRIGRHDGPPAAAEGKRARGELAPLLDLAGLSEIDRKRSLGLGYFEAGNRGRGPDFHKTALALLTAVRDAGLVDPAVESALARIRFANKLGGVLPHADAALADPGLGGMDRCAALYVRAEQLANEGRYAEALRGLDELTKLRRQSADWWLRAKCEHALGNIAGETAALETATKIDPRRWRDHAYLAELYQAQRDRVKADYHRRRAVP